MRQILKKHQNILQNIIYQNILVPTSVNIFTRYNYIKIINYVYSFYFMLNDIYYKILYIKLRNTLLDGNPRN